MVKNMDNIFIYIINFLLIFIFTWTILLISHKIYPSRNIGLMHKFLLCTVTGLLCLIVMNIYPVFVFNGILFFYVLVMFFTVWTMQEFHMIIYFTNSLVLNILSIRMIITNIMALVSGNSIHHIYTVNKYTAEISLALTLIILIIIVLFVSHLISEEMVFNMSIRYRARVGLNIWIGLCNIYLILQSTAYDNNNNIGLSVIQNQFMICIILLFADWSFLYYNMKILKLLRYKDENIRMQELSEGLTSNAVYRYNVNLSRDLILSSYPSFEDDENKYYSDAINKLALRYAHPKDADKIKETLDRYHLISCYEKGKKKIEFELRIKANDNNYVWYHINVILSCDEKSTNVYAYFYATDIQERMVEKESLSKAATTDGLTGLLNKVTSLEFIDQQIKFGGALFVIDVDNFKHVNDNYGHASGDLILQAISEQIKHTFRKDDILGRYGGDEFIAFIPSKSLTKERLDMLSSVLCDRCHNSLNVDIQGNFSISVGVAMAQPNQFNSFEAAFEIADTALYESKKKGKGTYTIF